MLEVARQGSAWRSFSATTADWTQNAPVMMTPGLSSCHKMCWDYGKDCETEMEGGNLQSFLLPLGHRNVSVVWAGEGGLERIRGSVDPVYASDHWLVGIRAGTGDASGSLPDGFAEIFNGVALAHVTPCAIVAVVPTLSPTQRVNASPIART